MSSRHGEKKKKNKTTSAKIVLSEEAPPQEIPLTPTRKESSMYKPPDSTLAFWGVVLGAAVFVIYFMQWRAMNQAMMIDQRAWISLGGEIRNQNKFAVGQPFAVIVTVKNIGKTPARDTHAGITIEPRAEGQQPRFERDTENAIASGVMIPNADYYGNPILTTCALENDAGRRQYDAVTSGSQTVYVHGRVTYQDVFRHPHWFTFCYHMMPQYDFSWALCSGGHQVDDDNE